MDFFENCAIVAMQSDNANFYACEIIICHKIHNKGTVSQWQIQVTIFLSGTDVTIAQFSKKSTFLSHDFETFQRKICQCVKSLA